MKQINYGGKSYGGYEPELEMYPNGAGSAEEDRYPNEDVEMDDFFIEEDE